MSLGLESILQAVGLKRRERLEGRRVTFRELVRSVAEGRETNPERIESLLDQAGKTAEDLTAAVELCLKRKALRSQLDSLPAKERQLQELRQKITAAEATYQAAKEKYESAMRPLEWNLRELRVELAQEGNIRHELLASFPEFDAVQRSEELASQAREALAEAAANDARVERDKALLDDSLKGGAGDPNSDAEKKRQGFLRDAIAQRKQAAKDARAQAAALEAEAADVRKLALEP